MSETLDNTTTESGKRPTFLTVLCILTWINSGLGALVFLLLTVAAGVIAEALSSIPGMDGFAEAGIAFFALMLLLSVGNIVGAAMMWKLKKTGFYIYAACNVIAFILPMILIEGWPFSIMGLFWVALFITLYGLNLKHLK